MEQRRHSEPSAEVNTRALGPVRARFINNTTQTFSDTHRYAPIRYIEPQTLRPLTQQQPRNEGQPNWIDSAIQSNIHALHSTHIHTDNLTHARPETRQRADTFITNNVRNLQGIRNLIDFEENTPPHAHTAYDTQSAVRQQVHPPYTDNTYRQQTTPARQLIQSWKTTYAGTGTEDIYEFVQNIREFQTTDNISDRDLLDNLTILLSGTARDWYRLNRENWNTRDEFEEDLLYTFYGQNHRDELEEKIKHYTQKENQPITPFLIEFRTLLARRIPPYPLETQLRLTYRNLQIAYKTFIKPYEFSNFAQLERAGREWEAHVDWHNKHTDKQTDTRNRQPTQPDRPTRPPLLPTPTYPPHNSLDRRTTAHSRDRSRHTNTINKQTDERSNTPYVTHRHNTATHRKHTRTIIPGR